MLATALETPIRGDFSASPTQTALMDSGAQRHAQGASNVVQVSGNQYFEREARFFDTFSKWTGRFELVEGFIEGYFAQRPTHSDSAFRNALDFGCGTGGLTTRLHNQYGCNKVIGYDPSEAMIEIANANINETPLTKELVESGKIRYVTELPTSLFGKCRLVTALHVQYHFKTCKELAEDYFGVIHKLLSPDGVAVIVSCPEHSVRTAQDNTVACIHPRDVPPKIWDDYLKNKENFTRHKQRVRSGDVYVPIRDLPYFKLKNGTQMKVRFTLDEPLPPQSIEIMDTFWSDAKIKKAAKEAGLVQTHQHSLKWRGHPDTYRAIVYARRSSLG